MLSSLSASLLPASFGSLFSPPLDGEQLHVSLTRGGRVALGPPALQIDAQRFNALLLPSPRAPMRLVRGELGALELSMDWKAFFSQPLKLVVRGLHLCLAPAHIRRPSTAAAGKQEQEQGEAWKESDLLEVAEEAKRTLLEALLPAGPSLLDSLKAKAAEGNNKGGWLSAPLKKLVAWVLDSLNLQVEDVHIEFMLHEDEGRAPSSGITTGEEVAGASQAEVIKAAEEVEERKGPQQLAESMAASVQAAQPSTASPSPVAMTSATSAHAPVSAPVTFGIELKRCIMQDTVKVEQQEVPSEYDNTKDMHVGLAVYCDTEASSRPVGASAAKGDVGEKEERKREEPSSAQTAPKHGHDYIIEPMAASMHIAFLSNFSEQMRMQARLICKDVQSSLHPAQLKGLAAIVAAIMANQTALYDEAEKVGARRFRSATPKDQEQYCRLIKKRMQGRKLSSNEESALDKMEKEIVLKDLLNMRAEVDKQLHVAKQIQEEQEASEASSSTTSPSVTPSDTPTHAAAEQREPSLWESAKLFFSDAVSRDAESTGATASSGGEEVKESSSLISGVGTLQSALEQASPFTLDVRVEAVAEEVRFVLFEDASKSVESALLALSLTDGALRAEVHPGGALSVKLGVKQITLADATQLVKHDKPELPSTYLRLVPALAVEEPGAESTASKKPEPSANKVFIMHSAEFYDVMPFLLSVHLLSSAKASAEERKLQEEASSSASVLPSGASVNATTSDEHVNTLDLRVSGFQAQLFLTLAGRLAHLPSLLRECAEPLLNVPSPPKPDLPAVAPSEPRSPLELISVLLPMRLRINLGGVQLLDFLQEGAPGKARLTKATVARSSTGVQTTGVQTGQESPFGEGEKYAEVLPAGMYRDEQGRLVDPSKEEWRCCSIL